jgi:hypothetical protein
MTANGAKPRESRASELLARLMNICVFRLCGPFDANDNVPITLEWRLAAGSRGDTVTVAVVVVVAVTFRADAAAVALLAARPRRPRRTSVDQLGFVVVVVVVVVVTVGIVAPVARLASSSGSVDQLLSTAASPVSPN